MNSGELYSSALSPRIFLLNLPIVIRVTGDNSLPLIEEIKGIVN